MSFKIKNTIQPKDFISIRENLNWSYLSYDLVKRAIDGSMVNVSVFEKEKCVGVGRIVGDKALKGMLTDIMVIKEYQKQGVGRLIVTTLIKELHNIIKDGECFQLEANPTFNNRDFYIKCGLKYKPENQDGVYLWIRK
jgi:GNAT superfamily N-acetyltransferase